MPDVEGDKPAKKRLNSYPIGFFHIDIAEVQTAKLYLYLYLLVAIDRTSKFALVQFAQSASRVTARLEMLDEEQERFRLDPIHQTPGSNPWNSAPWF